MRGGLVVTWGRLAVTDDDEMDDDLDLLGLLDFGQVYTWRAQERLKPGYLDALIADLRDGSKVVGIRSGREPRPPEAEAKYKAHMLELALQARLEIDAEREQARRQKPKRRKREG